MGKRICYIHIGPHKTGTTSIQGFLKENRAELLKHGYLVPKSEAKHGAHHALARKLCGQELRDHEQSVDANFARALDETPSEAVIISSEALSDLFIHRNYAKAFFARIRELTLEPKLVLFPRNPPQQINSLYSSVVRRFCRSDPFGAFVQEVTQRSGLRYLPLIELADAQNAELIVRAFTKKTSTHGVVPEFLQIFGLDTSEFRDTDVRLNEDAGPFTVSVARSVLRLIGRNGNQLKWLQTVRCATKLATYLEENRLADAWYCGLTTALARQIERELRPDSEAFAQRVWDRPWAAIFAADIGEEFTPNDFEMCRPDESTEHRLQQAIREMTVIAEQVAADPALAVKAPWNDFLERAGWTARAHIEEPCR
jgi:hypothetical protein